MKPVLIQLVGISMSQPHMRIGMMRHQGMDRDLGCDGQCKKSQQPARKNGSYETMRFQAVI